MSHPEFKLSHEWKLPMGVLAGDLMPGEQQAAVGCMDGVYLTDIATKSYERLYQHDSYVSSVASLGGESVLSAGYDGCLRWFNQSAGGLTRLAKLHDFWSWDLAVSSDRKIFASVTGQYLAGGYKYEPLPEREPSVQIGSVQSGKILHSLPHVPSVQAVAISPDGKSVAAGNLMGEVRVFDVDNGEIKSQFKTDAFTSWGIIKSHSYIGGIFSIEFTPDGQEMLLCGMGHMRDPMAANGRQLWQKWAWSHVEPNLVDQTHKDESGEGLMETLAIEPFGRYFLMAGRLRGGNYNVGFFDLSNGNKIGELKTGYRVTDAKFTSDGRRLLLFGSHGQPSKRNDKGVFPKFGKIQVYDINSAAT